ncbi:MAG: ABC transporter ATP-binding protein [Proteobacteria bacterium]|nr:ABC transporter ATP-binding protein [Pseudomonadota bacterium]
MLKIDNLSKTYQGEKSKALNNININIKKGEFVALLGPNGAGKSSVINVLAGNVKKDAGEINLGGYDFDSDELSTKKVIGIVPQEIIYDLAFTVNQALMHQSGYFGIAHNQRKVDQLLKALSLDDKKHTRAHDLSGGMKRRLLIAKALVHDPELLILDEPTAGVDIELRHSLYDFLERLHKKGTTIILTTHYLEEAEKLCDRVVMINHGKIVADASKKELVENVGNKISVNFSFDKELSIEEVNFLQDYAPELRNSRELSLQVVQEELAQVFKKVSDKGLNFSNVKTEHPKLEDIFLQMMRK